MTQAPRPQLLVIASHNAGKVAEIGELLAPLGMQVRSAAELNLPEPEETGASFAENAILKARAAASACGQWVLADDSGLCVDALGGAPGIYSARWAEPGKDFARAFARIERELGACGASAPYRAHFACVLCLASPDGTTQLFEGRIDGTLAFPPRGDAGFGYDPIFIPENDVRSFAEFSPAEKNRISHRAAAFKKLAEHLHLWKP